MSEKPWSTWCLRTWQTALRLPLDISGEWAASKVPENLTEPHAAAFLQGKCRPGRSAYRFNPRTKSAGEPSMSQKRTPAGCALKLGFAETAGLSFKFLAANLTFNLRVHACQTPAEFLEDLVTDDVDVRAPWMEALVQQWSDALE